MSIQENIYQANASSESGYGISRKDQEPVKEFDSGKPVMVGIADPTVWTGDGFIGALGTQTFINGEFVHIPELRSYDGVNYQPVRDALLDLPDYLDKNEVNTWAPDVLPDGLTGLVSGKTEDRFVIFRISRKSIDEPFKADNKPLIYDRPGFANIDPSVREIKDRDGKTVLVEVVYGSHHEPINLHLLSPDLRDLKTPRSFEILKCTPGKQYESLAEAPEMDIHPDKVGGGLTAGLYFSGHDTFGLKSDGSGIPGDSYAVSGRAISWVNDEPVCIDLKDVSPERKTNLVLVGNPEIHVENVGHHKKMTDRKGKLWWFVTGIDTANLEKDNTGTIIRSTWLVPMEVDDHGVVYNIYGMPVSKKIDGPSI